MVEQIAIRPVSNISVATDRDADKNDDGQKSHCRFIMRCGRNPMAFGMQYLQLGAFPDVNPCIMNYGG